MWKKVKFAASGLLEFWSFVLWMLIAAIPVVLVFVFCAYVITTCFGLAPKSVEQKAQVPPVATINHDALPNINASYMVYGGRLFLELGPVPNTQIEPEVATEEYLRCRQCGKMYTRCLDGVNWGCRDCGVSTLLHVERAK